MAVGEVRVCVGGGVSGGVALNEGSGGGEEEEDNVGEEEWEEEKL